MKIMKSQKLDRLCVWLPLLALAFTGCHSIGYKTGDRTAGTFRQASHALNAESEALDFTISSLNDLVENPATDLKPQFKTYSASLDRLIASVGETDKAVAKLRERSDVYFAAWDSEIEAMNYEAVRDQSESRRLEASNQVYSVVSRYDETQNVVKPLISYFQDIQKALGTDLTADGLSAARSIVENAANNTGKIQSALTQLTAEMIASSGRFSSTITGEPNRERLEKTSDSRADAANP
jgi:hypothetical protein